MPGDSAQQGDIDMPDILDPPALKQCKCVNWDCGPHTGQMPCTDFPAVDGAAPAPAASNAASAHVCVDAAHAGGMSCAASGAEGGIPLIGDISGTC
jgi:hypothetical protein